MSDKFTPWDEVFGPSTTPENPVTPTPVPVVIPDPVVIVPTPAPSPTPVVTPSSAPSGSRWQTIAAAVIVCVGMLGAGYFISGKSNPQPPTPVVVPSGPVVDATLSGLLPDDKARGMVSSYFRDVSKFLETSKALQTSGQVVEAVQQATKDLKASIGEPNWSNVNKPISDRLIKAMGSTPADGMPDVALDEPFLNGQTPRQILVKEYAQIGIDARGN